MRLLSKIGPLATTDSFDGVLMPVDPATSTTLGFAFVEYNTVEDAAQAENVLQGYSFDKNHSLKATQYSRGEYLKHNEALNEGCDYEEPEPPAFVEGPDTSSWLKDPSQRDQYVVRHGNETAVYWNDGRHTPSIDYDGKREREAGVAWCEYYVQWSPRGSYLATLVPAKGVILWGGEGYDKIRRIPCPGVEAVSFSPREGYLLASSSDRNDPHAVKVFCIQTGKLLRSFALFPPKFLPERNKDGSECTSADLQCFSPPPFQWSHDDAYLARMGKDLVSIYETPGMKLLERRSLAANGIHEFQFSPTSNILAYWAPEYGNQPAHVDLIELPSRKKLRQKNLFNVTGCSMQWQDRGQYLGVKVSRHTKSKKTLYNNLELFRLDEATKDVTNIPVEMLDVKDAIMAFAWEPKGSRFAMIHGESASATKVSVSFYDMNKKVEATGDKKKKGSGGGNSNNNNEDGQIVREVNLIETLVGKQCNRIYWSPAGATIVLASLGDLASGTLEFYDVRTKSLAVKEHYRANRVEWDPSGRTVATCVTQPIAGGHFKFAMDNGYTLWTFQGKQIYQQSYETFYQIQWRPRRDLLDEVSRRDVVKNLKRYERNFDSADRELRRSRYLAETKGKRKLRSDFRERVAHLRAIRDTQTEDRVALMGGYDENDERYYSTRNATVENVVSTKEEIV